MQAGVGKPTRPNSGTAGESPALASEMDPMEATELFKSWSITEPEYRDALKAAGCPGWLANELVTTEMQARFQSMKHEKDTVYG